MLELREKMIAFTGSRSNILSKPLFKPLPAGDRMRRRLDNGLTTETLRCEPTVMLEYDLQRTIDYFRRRWCFNAHPLRSRTDRCHP